jgi:hypothetical protein
MVMWVRIGGALLVTLAVMATLEALGVSALLGSREEASHEAQARARELFWTVIFAVVMATAVLAAVRRWVGHLRRALAPQALRRWDVT